MDLISLLIVIAVFGLITWAITTLIPMPPQFRTAIYVISVVCLVLYVLQAFGLFHGVPSIRIGK